MTDPLHDEVQRALAPDYAIERELGRGGMGAVFLARDLALDRPVAIKVLPPEYATRQELRERFMRETRTAASFSHPNIVPVHAVEERGGILCFVMGFVDGETLTQRVRRAGPLGAAEAVRMIQEVAWALSYAHGRGVVHRDVKPDNILIERATGRALVTDFGIARSPALSGLTMVGEVVGTPHFMSPEQAAGETVDGRSDLYSLGVVAFFGVTGRLPFDAPSAQAILAMHLTQRAPALASLRPDLPAPLAGAIDRLLAKEPAARFQSGEELVESLDAMRATRPEIAPAIRLFQVRANTVARSALLLLVLGPSVSNGMRSNNGKAIVLMAWGAAAVALILQVFGWMNDLAREGFRFDDIRSGLLAIAAEQDEANVKVHESPDARRRRRRELVFLAFDFLVGAALFVAGVSMRARVGNAYQYSTFAFTLVLVGSGLAMLAFVFAIARSRRSTHIDQRITRLWTGNLGRRMFAIASRRIKLPGATLTPSPTATGESGPLTVLAGLPRALRRELDGVEPALRRLEATRIELAQRDAQLGAALADASRTSPNGGAEQARRQLVDELTGARRETADRREAVAATLERVRLELLRLRSGLGSVERVKGELARGGWRVAGGG